MTHEVCSSSASSEAQTVKPFMLNVHSAYSWIPASCFDHGICVVVRDGASIRLKGCNAEELLCVPDGSVARTNIDSRNALHMALSEH